MYVMIHRIVEDKAWLFPTFNVEILLRSRFSSTSLWTTREIHAVSGRGEGTHFYIFCSFTENDEDPGNFGELWAWTPSLRSSSRRLEARGTEAMPLVTNRVIISFPLVGS
jgi:hypothetical protein